MDQHRDESAQARPILSVVIPCRNAADTLGTQLDALARQRCPVPWEVVVCDNGSTDKSRSIALSYQTRLPRLSIVDVPDVRGAGVARNRGVERAEGEWLAFCDADDEVATGWLEAMAKALTEHRFVAGALEPHRLNSGRTLGQREVPQESHLQWTDFGARLPHAGGGNLGIHRDLFVSLGGFDPHLRWHEDTDLCWRAQLSGEVLTFLPEAVVHVRLRSTVSRSMRQGWVYGRAYAVLDERYERAGLPGLGATPKPRASKRRVSARQRRVSDLVGNPRHLVWRMGHALGRRVQRWDRTSPIALGPPRLAIGDSASPMRELVTRSSN